MPITVSVSEHAHERFVQRVKTHSSEKMQQKALQAFYSGAFCMKSRLGRVIKRHRGYLYVFSSPAGNESPVCVTVLPADYLKKQQCAMVFALEMK